MSSIAICDFDGVIADSAEHTKIAQERAKAYLLQQASSLDREDERKALSSFFYSEQGFFDNRLIEYYQLMAGCSEALACLSEQYDHVIVLTSRPLSMREATLQWFTRWCPGYENITFIFKDSDESTIKTAAWKAHIVASFAKQYHTILFIDNDKRNREAVTAIAANLHNVNMAVKSCFEECFLNAHLP